MVTITKKEEQNVVTYTLKVSKKHIRLLIVSMTIAFVAGVALFFQMNF
jgi:hypothetical protein